MVDSGYIKEALIHYFRFKRGWICADEVYSGSFIGDIVIDSGKWTMEVEIKTSKSDLIRGESRKWSKGKNKHNEWNIGRTNKFALCVTEDLLEIAEDWINKNNKKYGLYVYLENKYSIQDKIWTRKTALKLHNNYDNKRYLKK